jgi:hypothetical protein
MKRASVFFPWFLVLLFVVAPATAGASSLVAISTQTLPNGTGGTPYSAIITASGGCKPYYWSTTGNLPPGVSPTASNTSATFAGTPQRRRQLHLHGRGQRLRRTHCQGDLHGGHPARRQSHCQSQLGCRHLARHSRL